MFVVLSAGMLTALSATMMSQAVSVFTDKKKCEDNDNNNCNDTHKTQKIDEKNKCKIENENKDHSKKNDNLNELACVNLAPIPERCITAVRKPGSIVDHTGTTIKGTNKTKMMGPIKGVIHFYF